MVFEQRSRAIVMLTRCVEKGREKCCVYWPLNSTQPVFYGDIQVTLLNESQYPNWTISEFKVNRNDESRTVKHFRYLSWPDFGIDLVLFLIRNDSNHLEANLINTPILFKPGVPEPPSTLSKR